VEVSVRGNEAKALGSRSKKLQILKGVSGYAMPGQTLFIMGASGAGKTSLLNALSDRIALKRGSRLSGSILINDQIKLNSEVFGKIAGYVMQDDVLFEVFTPREALRFAARLKLKASVEE
jgi:ATP-binding cassette subfamily G (WHITE) protein 2 (PDR)